MSRWKEADAVRGTEEEGDRKAKPERYNQRAVASGTNGVKTSYESKRAIIICKRAKRRALWVLETNVYSLLRSSPWVPNLGSLELETYPEEKVKGTRLTPAHHAGRDGRSLAEIRRCISSPQWSVCLAQAVVYHPQGRGEESLAGFP